MGETVSVIVASYGDKHFWDILAEIAIESVKLQTRPPDELHRIHGTSLDQCRNEGAALSRSDYLCFLDCDDELEPGYLEAMLRPGIAPLELRYPRVRYINESLNKDKLPEPITLPRRSLDRGNFMVIGTLMRRDLFEEAGGFRDLDAYEDWDLFIRCWLLGAEPRLIPDAIYRAHKRPGSRNTIQNPTAICQEIISYNKQWNADRKRRGA